MLGIIGIAITILSFHRLPLGLSRPDRAPSRRAGLTLAFCGGLVCFGRPVRGRLASRGVP